jgi:hypothetical protein
LAREDREDEMEGEFDYRNRDYDPDRDPNQAHLFSSNSDHGESGESRTDRRDSFS